MSAETVVPVAPVAKPEEETKVDETVDNLKEAKINNEETKGEESSKDTEGESEDAKDENDKENATIEDGEETKENGNAGESITTEEKNEDEAAS